MAAFCPPYVVFGTTLREFHEALGPFSCLALIGIGASLAYIPDYLTSSAEHRWLTMTGLLIGFALVAGLIGVWRVL
jgi:hypothetical protein